MNNKKEVDLKALFLNIAIVVAAIVLVTLSVLLIMDVNHDYQDYNNTVSNYLNSFKKGEYCDTIEMCFHDMMHDKGEKDLPECMAVTEYFVASSYYVLYKDDETRSVEFAEKMQDAKSRMGDFTYMSEEIDGLFENIGK